MSSIRPVLRSPFRSPFRSPWEGLGGDSFLLNRYPAALGLSLQKIAKDTTNVVEASYLDTDGTTQITQDCKTPKEYREFALRNDADLIRFADAGVAGSPAEDKRALLDGVDDTVSFAGYKGITGTTARTLCFNFETQAAGSTNENNILYYGASSVSNGNIISINIESGKVSVRVAGGLVLFGDGSLNDGKLHNAAIVFPSSPNTDNLKCFMDGAELTVDSLIAQSIDTDSDLDLIIGQFLTNTPFKGILADFNFFDSALSDADAKDFTLGNSITPTPVFRVNGYGNTNADWEDKIGSNNGTVNGSPALFTGQGFDAFARTVYDQSGNARNATQTTAAAQPRLVKDGVIDVQGLQAMKDFDGTDDYMRIARADLPTIGDKLTVSAVVRNNKANLIDSNIIIAQYDVGDNDRSYNLQFTSDEKIRLAFGDQSDGTFLGTIDTDAVINTNEKQVIGISFNSGTVKIYRNALEIPATGTAPSSLYDSPKDITLGSALDGATPSNFWDGQIGEAYVDYSVDNDIVKIQQDQMKRFGIT